MGADWGSNLGPGTPKIMNLPNVLVVLRTFSRICKHPQKPNENTRLSGAPEPKFDPKSVQNLPPGVSGVALSFFNGQHTVSQRQPTKTQKKHKQSQPLTDTKDNTNDYNLRPRPPPPTRRPLAQCRDKVLLPSPLEKLRDQPDRKMHGKGSPTTPPAQHRPKPGYTQHNLPTCNSINPVDRRMQKNVQPPQQADAQQHQPERPQNAQHHTQARTRPCAEGRDNRHIPQPEERHRHTSTRPTDRPTDRPTAE